MKKTPFFFRRPYIEKTIDFLIFTSWFVIGGIQESAIHREKLTFFFKFWQIIAFLGSKTPVLRQTPEKFVNWIQNQGIRIHSTRVLCCDTEFYSGNQLIIAILVNFGRLGLFWLYLRSQKKFCIIFCFLVLFKHQWIKKKYQTYNQDDKILCHMRDANSTLPCSVSYQAY